jgi:stage II sporulation protein P
MKYESGYSQDMRRKVKIYKLVTYLLISACVLLTVITAAVVQAVTYFSFTAVTEKALSLLAATETLAPSDVSYPLTMLDSGEVSDTAPELYAEPIVRSVDLSGNPLPGEIKIFNNETTYNPDVMQLLNAPYPDSLKISENAAPVLMSAGSELRQPLVLILHTHGTEAYYPIVRSESPTENIISVGAVMSDILNANGIPTLHCDIMHDKESFLNSYNRSKETILKYLDEYPSIKYIFDVHRDAVGDDVKIVTELGGGVGGAGVDVAQVMCVVGTDFKGGDHPKWLDNMNVAVKLQNMLNTAYPNIARPINMRSATFNEQYAPGSILLEIGSNGNTLTEAKRAAVLLANTISELIHTYS